MMKWQKRLKQAGWKLWCWGGLALCAAAPGWAATVGELRCEFLVNPQGIDAAAPRLSWQMQSNRRGARQTAFQVQVSSSPDRLKVGRADLWDSGKVPSDQSHLVRYAGRELASRQACHWRVRIWDEAGKVSRWSETASWSMGLLRPTDWQGRWIGKEDDHVTPRFEGADWIWHAADGDFNAVPAVLRTFRCRFELPDRPIRRAQLLLAGDNEFACAVNGRHAGAGQNFKVPGVMEVKGHLQPGRNVIAAWVRNSGDTPNPAGLTGKLVVEFESGESLVVPTGARWRTSDSEPAGWTSLEFDDSGWPPARVLGPAGMEPWGEMRLEGDRRLPARQLRKEFEVARPVRRATVYFSGLGLSELYINGEKVGDAVLSPGLTHYDARVFYVTHDVTDRLRRGRNAVGVWLGNGRYFAPRASSPTHTISYGFPKLLLQLEVEYADGTTEVVVSDGSWKLSTDGPIRANNEYDGEEYDARRELRGWAAAGFEDATWASAQEVAGPKGALCAEMINPIRVTGTLKPIALTEPRPGVFIFDLGQNMVGWCQLRVRGPAGTVVRLRDAETLQPDGTLYLDNLRDAKVTDLYTLKGRGTEIYEPRFTYHGFRYVEVTGYPGRPTLEAIRGRVVNDDLAAAGAFACSHPTLNRIYRNVVWGTRGNYRSISTDCPQRDERQGWLGDRSAFSRGETFLFNISALYAKWVRDFADGQKDNGSVSDVNPPYWPLYSDNVTWPASTVIIPGALLDQYADTGVIARHYPSMVRWVDHLSSFITNGLIARDQYGDWCVPPEDPKLIHSQDPARKTAPVILATSYFAHCLRLMARYATLLDKPEDARRFAVRAEELKAAFNERLYHPEKGYYDNGSQTSCVLPLAFDLAPPGERPRVFDHLVRKITDETQGHVGTGLIGGQWLCRVLSDGGRPDLVYRFATNTTYPSWGYMIEKGATTIWELWNGDTADPAMNSHNHVMLVGDLVIWLYEYLAGIQSDPAQPGFRHIVMKPQPVGDLTFVKASHRSPHGLIRSEWQLKENRFEWTLTIPPNSTATLHVPARDAAAVRESGRPLARAPGVQVVEAAAGRLVLKVGAGHYQFVSKP
ncbi:MAG TPA: family 78 glycoside hydrolase catalytic domain [Verrucomicrobiota bacterium]|nr:family 78 glycoside hydrolase catalytic domain [Verrucomicrobiota bacterium]